MTAEEIREIAIDSAKSYLAYLEQNNKGVQEVEVYDLTYPESKDLLIKLRLSQKLFDTEAIFFKNLRNGKKYDSTQVKVIEYDADKNVLLIRPTIEIETDFKGLRNSDLKVVSDLKFLIERVKTWYELNGAELALPTVVSSLDATSIKFISEQNFQPSDTQKKSLVNIFSTAFSYVWGAPGTGKTQFVLSYAVLHYLSQGKKVAILAPTNNAIEQVLRGAIKMTDKAGIDRKQILRLGTPSKKFAEEFSEICEEKGVQKKLNDIDKQISILERIINYDNALGSVKQKEDKLNLFNDLPAIFKSLSDTQKQFNEQLDVCKKQETDITYKCQELAKLELEKSRLERKQKTLFNKVLKLFSSTLTDTDKQLEVTQEKIIEELKAIDFLKYEEANFLKVLDGIKRALNSAQIQCSVVVSNIKSVFAEDAITEQNWESVRSKILSSITEEREKLNIDRHLSNEYKHLSILQVKAELEKNSAIRAKLAVSSTEERLKNVQVVACTLDGYIGRNLDSKLDAAHIFLDEAGYANVIKAMTLFNHRVPITFLGDHMQLPPVCEISDMDINQNENYRNMFLWAQSAIHIDHLFVKSRDESLQLYLTNSSFNPVRIKKTALNATYRFGENLANILGQHVYDNSFSSLNPIGETQIRFINAPKNEGMKSRTSINEVQAIKKITDELKRNGKNNYVVLTPYRPQFRLLNSHLPDESKELKILTVHGSQGREWDTVILSVVDTADKWFVDSTLPISKGLNLVNTAVSRAKKELIIVCDKNYWISQQGQLITDLLNTGKEILELRNMP